MIVTIQPALFVKAVETVVQNVPAEQRAEAVLRLVATRGQAYAQCGDQVAQTEVLVWEEGQCSVGAEEFLGLLRTYRYENVTIEANWQGLWIGGSAMPVISHSSWAEAPGPENVLVVTD
jgi:hypothetical protein